MTARRWEQRGDRVVVFGTPTRTRIACDALIVATSLPPARDILAASPGAPASLVADLRALRTTPVIVLRIWFVPAAPIAAHHESVVLPDGRFADVMFHLNAIGQSRAEDGIVVEVHCACSGRKASWRDASDAAILATALADLATIAPGLTAAHVDSQRPAEIQRHADSFTLYAPGDAGRRPGAETGVRGLLLAGDWTRADWSVWMGERAVVSGLRAANVVLGSLGKAAEPIARLPREGILLRLGRLAARVARRFLPVGG
jgi:isorenieratene synthase